MFFNRRNKALIDESVKNQIDDCFAIIEEFVSIESLMVKETVLPTRDFFKQKYDGKREDGIYIFQRVCFFMDIDPNEIIFDYYSEKNNVELSSGLMPVLEEDQNTTLTNYIEYDNGDVEILVEEHALLDPLNLIALISHEIGQYKLRKKFNYLEEDHVLIEVLVIYYGLGIFSANQSSLEMKTWSNGGYSGWEMNGGNSYLSSSSFGYALAYYSHLKNDFSNNNWKKYLNKDILKNYKKSFKQYFQNEQK